MGRKILLATLLTLLIMCMSISITLDTQLAGERNTLDTEISNTKSFDENSIQSGERVSFDVVAGNGTGEMGGYYGWVINPDEKYSYSRHLYVKVLPSADIHKIVLLANASGYETVLVTEFLEYDPLHVRRVSVSHHIILYPNNISVWFTIIVLENGYVTVKVHSDYFLRDNWMRNVFSKMFQDTHLPSDTISQFELHVNWFYHLCEIIE